MIRPRTYYRLSITIMGLLCFVVVVAAFFVVRTAQDKILSEQDLKYTLLSMDRAVILATVRSDGEGSFIDHISSAGEGLFGWDKGSLQGKPIEVLMPPEVKQAHKRGLEAFFKRRKENPDNQEWKSHIVDCDGLRKDGTTFPIFVIITEADRVSEDSWYFFVIIVDARNAKVVLSKKDGSAFRRRQA